MASARREESENLGGRHRRERKGEIVLIIYQ